MGCRNSFHICSLRSFFFLCVYVWLIFICNFFSRYSQCFSYLHLSIFDVYFSLLDQQSNEKKNFFCWSLKLHFGKSIHTRKFRWKKIFQQKDPVKYFNCQCTRNARTITWHSLINALDSVCACTFPSLLPNGGGERVLTKNRNLRTRHVSSWIDHTHE